MLFKQLSRLPNKLAKRLRREHTVAIVFSGQTPESG